MIYLNMVYIKKMIKYTTKNNPLRFYLNNKVFYCYNDMLIYYIQNKDKLQL